MSDFSKNYGAKPPASSSNLSQSKSAYIRITSNPHDQSFSNRPENQTIHLNPFQRGKKSAFYTF